MVDTLDFVLVVSLSLLSLCFLVFLAFFVPILIQIARIFDSINTILVMSKDSLAKVLRKINSATDKAETLGSNFSRKVKTWFVGLKAGAKSFFKTAKTR